jgi:hypothetical protein
LEQGNLITAMVILLILVKYYWSNHSHMDT